MVFYTFVFHLAIPELQHVYHIIDKEAASEQAEYLKGLLKKGFFLIVIVCITSILHVFVYAYISTFWSVHGSSAQEEFDHVYSTVNKKKKKTESEQSQDGSESTEKEVATCMTFHHSRA